MQATLRSLIRDSVGEAPRHLKEIYAIVLSVRPGVAPETIRARVYEQMADGVILRVAPGVYVAADGPARLLLVKGDAWRFLAACPPRVCDLILTDPAVKMGTSKHLGAGTTKATARSRERSYARRDLDEAWLREAFRVLKSERAWAKQGGGETIGGGALVVILPAETRTTWPHIRRLIARAEKCGFTYYGRATWVHTRGLGYDVGAVQGDPVLVFQKGRRGLLFDPKFTNVIVEPSLRNPAHGTAHEAEKPAALFLRLIRAFARPGMFVLDCFAGRARWARLAVAMGYTVALVDREAQWVRAMKGDWEA